MKKTNFILSFKKSIFFVIPFLVTSCGTTLKSTDGTKIYFKRENVSCEYDNYWYEKSFRLTNGKTGYMLAKNYRCTAYGVATLLNGVRQNYSDKSTCETILKNAKGRWEFFTSLNSNVEKYIACKAAREFNKDCQPDDNIFFRVFFNNCKIYLPPDLSWDQKVNFDPTGVFWNHPISR